jgi:hypothetical protein
VTISGRLDPEVSIKLSDINGRIIKEISTNISLPSIDIILTALSPGIYFITVENYIQKIILLD